MFSIPEDISLSAALQSLVHFLTFSPSRPKGAPRRGFGHSAGQLGEAAMVHAPSLRKQCPTLYMIINLPIVLKVLHGNKMAVHYSKVRAQTCYVCHIHKTAVKVV